ncbi:MAG: hypothetical protein JXR83_00855 [Deltaproteobacteria bacterium]|nr:hypothetical protein [Deltaproteobacteria bacterium]
MRILPATGHLLVAALLVAALLVAAAACPLTPPAPDGSGDAAAEDAASDAAGGDRGPDASDLDSGAEDAGVCLTDDGYEPNNQPDQAAEIAAPVDLQGLQMCDDADWYALTAPADSGLAVTIDFDNTGADLDLHLYRADDTSSPLQISAGYGDQERVVEPLLIAETRLLVAVLRRAEGRGSAYRLRVEVFAGGHCSDDRFEPNDSAEQAAAIGSGALGLVSCPGNPDYFGFAVAEPGAGSRVVVAHGPTPLVVALTEAGQSAPIGQFRLDAAAGLTVVTFTSVTGVRYQLAVTRPGGEEPVRYAIAIYGAPPPNDDCAQAQAIAPGAPVSGTTVNAVNDYQFNRGSGSCTGWAEVGPDVVYLVTVPAGETLQAMLTADADLALVALADCATRCCLVGADDHPAYRGEAIAYRNDSAWPLPVYLVVDSLLASVSGPFDLEVWFGGGVRDGGAIAVASGPCQPDLGLDAGVPER